MNCVIPPATLTGKCHGRRPRLAFLENAFLASSSESSWSGLPYHMRRAMEAAGADVVPVRVQDPGGWPYLERWMHYAYWRLLKKQRYLRHSESRLLREYGRQASERLREQPFDAVFTPTSWLAAYLETPLPLILWSDATFANMLNFYPAFSRLAPCSLQDGHRAERGALERCHRACFSSEWAAKSAIEVYGMPEDRVEVLPFGANIKKELTSDEVDAVIASRPRTCCRLLFAGVDWERKGAPLAIEVMQRLQQRGLAVQLTIAGCLPPGNVAIPPGVQITEYISKATDSGRQRLDILFRTSHVFILPTRADCTPCVFSEASAYALPCVSTGVGGVRSVIRDGINGHTFPPSASAAEYADWIARLMADRPGYEQLCRSSWNESQTRLSWKRSAERIVAQLPAGPTPFGSGSGFVGRADSLALG